MDHNEERKALFFDIDGTILSELNGTIPESAKAAIGAYAVYDTGRSAEHGFCRLPVRLRDRYHLSGRAYFQQGCPGSGRPSAAGSDYPVQYGCGTGRAEQYLFS